jgi:uncharacterized protein
LRVVVDASTIVGAALRADSIPQQALLLARERHTIALSGAVLGEIEAVLKRPKFAGILTDDRREEILGLLAAAAVWVEPALRVGDCRDGKDNKYLELAAAAGAGVIISSDEDLLVLDPWRGIRLLRPREFLAAAEAG